VSVFRNDNDTNNNNDLFSGMEHFDCLTLEKVLEPLANELRNLDAEAFLQLDRVSLGARLCDG
jgi:hypothetical protein